MLQQFHIIPTTTGAVKPAFCKILLFLSSANASWYWYLQTWRCLGWFLKCFTPTKPGVLLGAMACVAYVIKQTRSDALRRKFLCNIMQTAASYEEWKHGAILLEKCSESHFHSQKCNSYDEELIIAKLEVKGCKSENMMFCLRADLVRNLGDICNPEIHKRRLQMPPLIQQYIKQDWIASQRWCCIRSISLGCSWNPNNLLPRVIAGSSAGSIVGAFTATRLWAELQLFFDDPTFPMDFFESMGSIFNIAHKLLTKGALQDIGALQRQMRKLIGDMTFQEAYDLTGRVLGISVCSTRRHEPPRLLSYLTSPHVVIWSAVTASCSFPGLFEAQELMAKNRQGHLVPYHHTSSHVGHRPWRDGSLESDLPFMKLKELFNVNHFIVSQTNPHIAPLLRLKEFVRACGGNFAAKLAQLILMEVKHRCNQVLELELGMRNVAQFFGQDWEGDITIVMPATLGQIVRMIQNPTISDLRKAVMQGRRCTWPKLSAIEANCGIEFMLDECSFKLNAIARLSNIRNNSC